MYGYITSVGESWYRHVRDVRHGELNLWRPGIQTRFRAVEPGEPVFFRLRAPHDRIVGLGFLAHFSVVPVSFAWRVFGRANGAESFLSLRNELEYSRSQHELEGDREGDPSLASVLVTGAVVLDEQDWIATPSDLDDHAGRGKRYDLTVGEGRTLWKACTAHLHGWSHEGFPAGPRFGPRSFHVAVLDAWGRRCAITGEGVIAALEAARFSTAVDGSFSLTNGILLRSDLAHLLEAGYIGISPDHKVVVSRAVPAGEMGRDYQRLEGTGIRLPDDRSVHPDQELLWWHLKSIFIQ